MGRLMNWRMIYAFLISNDVLNLIYISYIKNTRFTVSLVFCINEHTLYILYTLGITGVQCTTDYNVFNKHLFINNVQLVDIYILCAHSVH